MQTTVGALQSFTVKVYSYSALLPQPSVMNHLILCVPCGSSGTTWVFCCAGCSSVRKPSCVATGYGLLDREAPFLVVRNVALVELAWRAAREVRRVQVAVQHVVPAETAMPNVLTEFTTVSMMLSPSRSRNNRYSMFTFEPRAGVRARDAKVGWLLAQVVCLDTVVPPVHLVPQLAVVWRQPVLVAAIRGHGVVPVGA
jgi:hypothetical protein